MSRSMYGVPMDLYAEDEELDPLAGSGIDPAALSAALDEVALEAKAPPEHVEVKRELPPEVMGTGGSGRAGAGPVVTYKPRLPPAGYGAGLGGGDLAAAQRADANRTAQNDTGAAMYATFARKPMPAQAASSQARDVMVQRQGVDQEEALQGRQRSAAINAERSDPASQSSENQRAFLRAVDPKTAEAIGPYLDRMSYADINERFPYLKALSAERAAKENAATRLRAEQAAKDAARAEKLGDRADDRTYQEQRDARQDAAALARARVMAGLRAGEQEGKAAEGTSVPGYEAAPGERPTKDDAKLVKVSLQAREKIRKYADEMGAIHGRVGTELFGADSERMDQLREAILVEAKNAAELGALSGDDMMIVTRLMGASPTSWAGKGKALLGNDNTQSNLKGLKDWADTGVEASLKTRGYRKKAAEGPGATGDKASAAETWARSHPDDPRAAAILGKLGLDP